MIKELIIVGIGSFLGGSTRFLVSKIIDNNFKCGLPLGTLTINVMGCMLIGIISGMANNSTLLSPSAKLILTTGFCGGFTTFSTFMNENYTLFKDDNYLYMLLYIFGSLALGFIAVITGHHIGKMIM